MSTKLILKGGLGQFSPLSTDYLLSFLLCQNDTKWKLVGLFLHQRNINLEKCFSINTFTLLTL